MILEKQVEQWVRSQIFCPSLWMHVPKFPWEVAGGGGDNMAAKITVFRD